MRQASRLVAGWLAGVAVTGLQAHTAGTTANAAPPQPVQTPQTPAPDAASQPDGTAVPPQIEFRGADGKPLPPEMQRLLEQRLRDDPTLLKRGLATPSPDAGQGDIVVTGQRPRGSVIGDIPPERTFNPFDIRAYGASDIGELIEALGPQVGSDRGEGGSGPITLLNGKRVASFTEIASIPPEAIERMEVFPEELALAYGYRADQKVVNIVTFARFDSQAGQARYAVPTDGGRDTLGVSGRYLRIRDDTRTSVDLDYDRSGSLLESERDIRQVDGTSDLGRFRTLLPATERVAFNGTVGGALFPDITSTLNARFEATEVESLLGLGGDGPVRRDSDTRVAHLGTSLGGLLGTWAWSFTGNYDRTATTSLTDSRIAPGTREEARSVDSLARADLLMSGTLLTLPSGPVSASLAGGLATRDFTARSVRGDLTDAAALSRDSGRVQASIDIPIVRRAGDAPTLLGNLSANANLAVEELSDFGTLRTLGYGLRWSPVGAIGVTLSAAHEARAPTVEQLGAPLTVTPNVRTFDFNRREAIDITRIFGGNPGLRADDRRVLTLGIDAKPFARTDLTMSIDYTATRIDDPIAPFPIPTPEIEAAFPERFVRGADGRLAQIDSRPLNFARSSEEQLRWGVNFTKPLGPVVPGMQQGSVRFSGPMTEADIQRRYPGATVIRMDPNSPAAAGRLDRLTSRLNLSLYHIWRLENDVAVRDGVPVLDLLNGSAIGNRGGRPRHEIEMQAGVFRRGLGARMTANWQSGTTVRGLPPGPDGVAGDLDFGSLATVNLSLFANLADRMGGLNAPGWAKGARISANVTNLFNSRPDVRDATGSIPIAYQPATLDPLGRSIFLSLRKVF